MTPKPKILKKVEELSDKIVKNIARGIPIEMESADGKSVIFNPDFRVEPPGHPYTCHCFYGKEQVFCDLDITLIHSPEPTHSHGKLLYDCIVRQYARLFLEGKDKLEEETNENRTGKPAETV